MRCARLLMIVLLISAMACWWLCGRAHATDRQADTAAIRAAAAGYVRALERGNAEELASFWTSDGDYIDESGASHPSSTLIAEAVQAAASGHRPQVKLVESDLRFLANDVALEDGTSEITSSSGYTTRGRFSAIWVRHDGGWRLASLREARIDTDQPAQLADLAWMIGEWTGQSGDTTLDVSARWNVSETFLLRDLKVIRDGKVVFQGSQRIGWDPISRKLKLWLFDSDGGYGEGTLVRQTDGWTIVSAGVLPDGRRVASTSRIIPQGNDRFQLQSVRGDSAAGPARVDVDFVRKTPGK